MGLLVECPKCKNRNSLKAKTCKCGFLLAKFSGRVYWVEYYRDGYRKRERIGPNKAAAEQREREIKSAIVEGRHIRKSPDTRTTFKALADWYLSLPEVKAKRSYKRDKQLVAHLLPFFGDRLLKDVTPALVEAYRRERLAEPAHRNPAALVKPATVNREVTCLKTIFNKAMRNGKAERNPGQGVRQLKENNKRDRVLSEGEYLRLLAHSQENLRPIIKLAYHTGMRKAEITGLTWGQVDLKEGFITLRPEDTKTNEGRLVPLNREMMEMFKAMPRGLPGVLVFALHNIQRAFEKARQGAQLGDFTFHDLRHTFINNRRLEGHDYFRIMAITGHKTMSVFRRYNTVSKEELRATVGEKI